MNRRFGCALAAFLIFATSLPAVAAPQVGLTVVELSPARAARPARRPTPSWPRWPHRGATSYRSASA